MPTTLLAGGSGLIGKRLSEMLHAQGHSVRLLTRTPRGEGQFAWNPAAGTLDETALEGIDYVINLAGAGIADRRWTAARKRALVESRVQSADVLRRAFERSGLRPRAYISASAIGYYGDSGEALMAEASAPADQSFMVECCQKWEQAADAVAALGIRTVQLRIGVVLATEGGALAEFVKPLRFGLGTYFADGQAWYSWIHRDDVCRAFIWALENEAAEGVFNAVAPQPARNRDLVRATARAMRQPVLMLPAPAFALRLMLGEMSAVVLNSNRVSAEKIERAGFQFEFPALESALGEIFGT
jgi:uncharacterized protein (TIGR01777 family)